jgi:hypothetical protein
LSWSETCRAFAGRRIVAIPETIAFCRPAGFRKSLRSLLVSFAVSTPST